MNNSDRRAFISKIASGTAAAVGVATVGASPALAGPEILKLDSGIKYAITKPSEKEYPRVGDLVLVEFTGYLANGQVCTVRSVERYPTIELGCLICICLEASMCCGYIF